MSRPIAVAPSVLPVDFARLGDECMALEKAGVDLIHWDVMDGVFVPNLTFGPDVIASTRSLVDIEFEAHLMVVEPDRLLDRYVEAGCSTVLVHAEACDHLHRTLSHIAELGATPGVALNPHTPADVIRHVRDLLGVVLVMTVNPGFSGQSFIASQVEKIRRIKAMIGDRSIEIEVDGGINADNVKMVTEAGANVVVAGNAVFSGDDYAAAIGALRDAAG